MSMPFNVPSGNIVPPVNMGPPRMEPPPIIPPVYRTTTPPPRPTPKPRVIAKKEDKKILPPIGVDDILNELKTNTKDEVNDVISQMTDRKSLEEKKTSDDGGFDLKDFRIDDRRSEERRSEGKSVKDISASDIMSEMASTVGGGSTVSRSRRNGKSVRTMTLNL